MAFKMNGHALPGIKQDTKKAARAGVKAGGIQKSSRAKAAAGKVKRVQAMDDAVKSAAGKSATKYGEAPTKYGGAGKVAKRVRAASDTVKKAPKAAMDMAAKQKIKSGEAPTKYHRDKDVY